MDFLDTRVLCYYEEEFNFSLDQWKQMLAAIEVYASEALNVTETHKLSVNKLESIEAVERYDR